MRRLMLILSGLGTGTAFFALFCGCVFYQCMPVQAQVLPDVQHRLRFPCQAEDTSLWVLGLASYEGPFREDGSGEEVTNVAALVIENRGGTQLAEGAVVLDWESDRYVFEFSCLPPGARILVPEKDRKQLEMHDYSKCYGWSRGIYPEFPGAVCVEEAEGNGLLITNLTGGRIPMLRLQFKQYDTASGMYIGGITYSLEIKDLIVDEIRKVTPYGYVRGSCKVTGVFAEYTEG